MVLSFACSVGQDWLVVMVAICVTIRGDFLRVSPVTRLPVDGGRKVKRREPIFWAREFWTQTRFHENTLGRKSIVSQGLDSLLVLVLSGGYILIFRRPWSKLVIFLRTPDIVNFSWFLLFLFFSDLFVEFFVGSLFPSILFVVDLVEFGEIEFEIEFLYFGLESLILLGLELIVLLDDPLDIPVIKIPDEVVDLLVLKLLGLDFFLLDG